MPSGVEPTSGEEPGAALTLADKLDRCFKTMHPADRGEWTYKEVSAGVAAMGVTCSPSYLWQLRRGHRDNPTLRQLEAIARFFHVPMTYFVGTEEEIDQVDAQMSVVQAMRTPGVRDVALRASALSPAGLRAIANIITELESVPGMTRPRSRRRRTGEAPEQAAPTPLDDDAAS